MSILYEVDGKELIPIVLKPFRECEILKSAFEKKNPTKKYIIKKLNDNKGK